MHRRFRLSLLWTLLWCAMLPYGCSADPPPPDKAKLEQEVQQLNEHRQKEWGETPSTPN
jgi:hypothetical protein